MSVRAARTALTLPVPLDKYDAENERQTRRAIQDVVTQLSSSLGTSLPWIEVKAQGPNDTVRIQAAIDEMAASVPLTAVGDTIGGGIVLLSSPAYVAEGLVLKYGVHVVGLGQKACKITPPSFGSTAVAVWLLNTGIVAYASIRGMTIQGVGNAGQHGIYFHAVETMQSGFTQGGLWNSTFSNLTVTGFVGESIWFHAGGDNFLAPIQFINLDQIEAYCPSTTRRALRLTGECNQIKTIGPCLFVGPGQTSGGTIVLLERTVSPTTFVNNGDIAPNIIGFNLTSFQNNTRGITIERALNVNIGHCYFENLSEGAYVDVSANVILAECGFANVGHVPTLLTGFCVKVNSGSCVVRDNSFAYSSPTLAADLHYVRVGGSSGRLQLLGSHFDTTGIRTTGITAGPVNVTSATLDVTGYRSVFVNASATVITTITQDSLPVGEMLVLKAHSGTITLGSGGNIYFDSTPNRFKSPLIVPADTYVLLTRIDLSGGGTDTWAILAAAENANYVRPFGCNGQLPQTQAGIGSVAPPGGVGTAAGGWDTAAHRDAAIALLNNIRAALINNGIG